MYALPMLPHALLALVATFATPELRAYALTQDGPHDGTILASAAVHRVDPFTLKALLWEESKLRPDAVNPRTGCAGIAQWCPSGRRGLEQLRGRPFTRAHALNPHEAIPAAAFMLAHLQRRWGAHGGIVWYNGGVDRHRFARGVVRTEARLRLAAGMPPKRDRGGTQSRRGRAQGPDA